MDPFHLIAWATDALDQVRRAVWNAARGGRGKRTTASAALKNARWALWKNPDRLSAEQKATLAAIQQTNKPLYLGVSRSCCDVSRVDSEKCL